MCVFLLSPLEHGDKEAAQAHFVQLCEDDYPGWLAANDLSALRPADLAYCPVSLTRAEIGAAASRGNSLYPTGNEPAQHLPLGRHCWPQLLTVPVFDSDRLCRRWHSPAKRLLPARGLYSPHQLGRVAARRV